MLRSRAAGLLLALITLLAFLPVLQNGFLNYDDDDYVTNNPEVQKGLTAAGLQWSFTTGHASNWHPLTWLSHMADCDLFRLNPAGHHLVNVLFHSANAALLFILLLRLTQRTGPSLLVAALFAWHPLHVESVAWVAERKDVLSTFFGLLALLSYTKYAKENSRRSYWLALGFFALGLLAKPMLVTLPCVLLLLDGWPLQRFRPANWQRLVLEKTPFFFLAAASCIITFVAQRQEAMASLQKVPLELRFGNAIIAYADYLAKTICPANLAVFYPLPKQVSAPALILSATVLTLISTLAILAGRRRPYVLVGWLWFLGTLVPVIGLVQVGDQALADRYTYFPLNGIFLIAVLAADDFTKKFPRTKIFFSAAAVLVCAGSLWLTERQISYWRSSETLFTHALAVTSDNALAHLNLGEAFQEQRRLADALAQYRAVLRLDPSRFEAYNNLGRILNDQGRPAEALDYCRVAVRLNFRSASAHTSLGIVLAELKQFVDATNEFFQSMQLDPDYAPAQFQTGRTLLLQGHDAEALAYFRAALRLEPKNLQMLIFTARVLAADENPQGRNGAEALAIAGHIVQLAGSASSVVLDTLGAALAENGRFDEAAQVAQQAVTLAQLAGQKDDAAEIQHRLELYRQHQPWRKSFRAN